MRKQKSVLKALKRPSTLPAKGFSWEIPDVPSRKHFYDQIYGLSQLQNNAFFAIASSFSVKYGSADNLCLVFAFLGIAIFTFLNSRLAKTIHGACSFINPRSKEDGEKICKMSKIYELSNSFISLGMMLFEQRLEWSQSGHHKLVNFFLD